MADKKMTQLTVSDAAIASYLDELLHTATSTAEQEQLLAPVTEALEPEPVSVELPMTEAPQPVVEEPAEVPEPAPEVQKKAEPVSTVPPARPDWSEQPFECLIFTVAGLQLAVPLVLLGAIHKIEEEIRSLPGSPDWYMGIRPGSDGNLRVVDSAQWIMAGRVPENARENYRFIIRLDDSPWGLACDSVGQSFTLDPGQVRWRTARSQRPWLAGTVIDHMCALIDVRAMSELLMRAEREQRLDLS
ncbi:MAG: chemotaxis protein CheW [Gammaproteobacteria bacterium]|uniref:CheW-like domain protein n=1 Tax=Marinobacter litoralis TaxID=187981 RepID=A0A3M2RKL1_9GAMM|nr:chemotaxis protein CheW [Marinobacter litoralis]MBR9870554.1 chemotaxis protein CheW [Gammaproteobacteria bacterium]RMJ05876.1 CheW-like domain protein [Marinobacter litoralis]